MLTPAVAITYGKHFLTCASGVGLMNLSEPRWYLSRSAFWYGGSITAFARVTAFIVAGFATMAVFNS